MYVCMYVCITGSIDDSLSFGGTHFWVRFYRFHSLLKRTILEMFVEPFEGMLSILYSSFNRLQFLSITLQPGLGRHGFFSGFITSLGRKCSYRTTHNRRVISRQSNVQLIMIDTNPFHL